MTIVRPIQILIVVICLLIFRRIDRGIIHFSHNKIRHTSYDTANNCIQTLFKPLYILRKDHNNCWLFSRLVEMKLLIFLLFVQRFSYPFLVKCTVPVTISSQGNTTAHAVSTSGLTYCHTPAK